MFDANVFAGELLVAQNEAHGMSFSVKAVRVSMSFLYDMMGSGLLSLETWQSASHTGNEITFQQAISGSGILTFIVTEALQGKTYDFIVESADGSRLIVELRNAGPAGVILVPAMHQ